MKFEETIQACFDYYPSLFQIREEVLNQFFSVVGNGYKWIDGELIGEDRPPVNPLGPDGKAKQYKIWTHKEQRKNAYDFLTKEENKIIAMASLYLDEDKTLESKYLDPKPDDDEMVPRKFNLYPPSRRYSKMFLFPEDTKPDWKAGVKEFLEYIMDNVPADAVVDTMDKIKPPIFSVILRKQDIIEFYEAEFGKR